MAERQPNQGKRGRDVDKENNNLGFKPGTTAAEIRAFRDQHITVNGMLDPQALQAWALMERAALAAEANELARQLAAGDADDIAAVRAEIEEMNDTIFGISVDLADLFSHCEAVLNAPGAEAPIDALRVSIEKLRKKFDVKNPKARAAAAGASADGEEGDQAATQGEVAPAGEQGGGGPTTVGL